MKFKEVFVALGLAVSFLAGGMLVAMTTAEPNEKGVQEMQQELEIAKQQKQIDKLELENRELKNGKTINRCMYTDLQLIYLDTEIGMYADEVYAMWQDKADICTREREYKGNYSILVGYTSNENFGEEYAYSDIRGTYVEIGIDKDSNKVDKLEYYEKYGDDRKNDKMCMDEKMYPATKAGINWHHFDNKVQQINFLKGGN